MHKSIVVICLSAAIILCGCGGKKVQLSSVPTSAPESETEIKQKKPLQIAEQLNHVSATGEIAAFVQGKNSFFCLKREKGKNVIFSWNLKTGRRTKKALSCSLVGRIEVQQTKGFIVFYDENKKIVVIDNNFIIKDELTVKNKLVDGFHRNYCVLPNEKKIVYTKEKLKNGQWYQEVNECDYSGKNKRQICRIEDVDKSVGKVNKITGLALSKDEKILFFTGLFFRTRDANETSSPCFGEINRHTGKVTSVQEEKNFGQLIGNKMMFVDGLREKGIASSGYITCLDNNGKQENFSFRKKEESQEVVASDGGTYYLSYIKMDEDETTKISCYSFQKSTCQWQKEIPKYVSEIWYYEQGKILIYSFYDNNRKLCFKEENIKNVQ